MRGTIALSISRRWDQGRRGQQLLSPHPLRSLSGQMWSTTLSPLPHQIISCFGQRQPSQIHSVRQLQQPPAQQYFSLILLQHQLPATSQPILFFSHTTTATSFSCSPAIRVYVRIEIRIIYFSNMILHVFALAHTLYYYYPAAANRLAKKKSWPSNWMRARGTGGGRCSICPYLRQFAGEIHLSVRWHRLGHVLLRRHAPPDAAAM